MRIGLPWWIGAGPALRGVETAAEFGFDFIEISLDEPWPQGLNVGEVRDAASDHGLALGFHAPWRGQSLAHPRGVLARAAAAVAQECIDLALGAKAEYVVFHATGRAFGNYPVPDVVERGLEQARQSLRALAKTAGRDIALMVENIAPPLATPADLETFLEPVPEVGFCYDPGHAADAVHREVPGATAELDVWLKTLGRRYALLHLMDHVVTARGVVDHLVPGAGEADIEAIVQCSREAGCERVLIEAFYRDATRTEATPADLAKAAEHIRSL